MSGSRPAAPEAQATAFVGRRAELDACTAALVAARSGAGRIVLASGEAGIGKTRLVDELGRDAAEQGFDVFVGRCYEVDGAPAFWPWMQVLRALVRKRQTASFVADLGPAAADLATLVPELGVSRPAAASKDPAVARFLLFDAVATLFRRTAATGPLVVALDDLHRADTPSLRLLEFLVPHLRDMALVVLATFRDSPHDLDHPIAATLGELSRELSTVRLPLTGLAPDALAALLASVIGRTPDAHVVDSVHGRTEGNPLFVTEIARRLALDGDVDALSAEMRTTIGRHVHEASPACLDVFTAAAVFGRELRSDALLRMIGTTHDALQPLLVEAAQRGLMAVATGDPRRLRFTHVLTRDVLYDGIPEPERAAWHRRAAEALATVTAEEIAPPLAELAAHFKRAGDARATEYARAAGEEARKVHAYEEAAAQYALAVAAAEQLGTFDPRLHTDLLIDLAEVQRLGGNLDASKQTVLRAAESARERGAAAQLAQAALTYGPRFDFGEGAVVDPLLVGLLSEAVDALDGADDPVLVRILGRLALARYWEFGAEDERARLTDRALAMARRLGSPAVLVEALIFRHNATWAPGTLAERLALLEEVAALTEAHHDSDLTFQRHLLRAADALETNDVLTCDAEMAACGRIAEQTRHPFHRVEIAGFLSLRAAMRGDADECARHAARVGEIGGRWFPLFAEMAQAMLYLARARSRAEWEAVIPGFRAHVDAHPGTPGVHALLAVVLCEAGRITEARAAFEVLAKDRFRSIAVDAVRVMSLTLAADACGRLGDAASAAQLYPLLEPYRAHNALAFVSHQWWGCAAHRLGVLARLLARLDDAAAHFEDALARHLYVGDVRRTAETRLEYAVLLHERNRDGDGIRAAELLRDAEAIAVTFGLETLRERIAAFRTPTVDDVPASSAASGETGVFRRDGGDFVVTYAGRTVQLRATRGLEYLAPLLYAPLREHHVTELVARVTGNADAAVPTADADAHVAYRERLEAIAEEIAEAERLADSGRLGRARDTRAALVEDLTRGAPSKRAVAHVERARVTVTKGLSAAISRIRAVHPALAQHLAATIRRGYVCVYVPDPRRPIRWEA